jgi:hypothetical protein
VRARPYDSQWLPIVTRSGHLAPGPRDFLAAVAKMLQTSGELTGYKSYSIPAGVLGFLAVRIKPFVTVAARSHLCRPVYGANRAASRRCAIPPPILIWLAGFPTDFLVVRFTRLLRVRVPAPWLPYRFPRGRLGVGVTAFRQQPWLPYRFPRGRLRAAQRPGILATSFLSASFASACKRAITPCR